MHQITFLEPCRKHSRWGLLLLLSLKKYSLLKALRRAKSRLWTFRGICTKLLSPNKSRQKCSCRGKMLQVVYCICVLLTHEFRNGFKIHWRIEFIMLTLCFICISMTADDVMVVCTFCLFCEFMAFAQSWVLFHSQCSVSECLNTV